MSRSYSDIGNPEPLAEYSTPRVVRRSLLLHLWRAQLIVLLPLLLAVWWLALSPTQVALLALAAGLLSLLIARVVAQQIAARVDTLTASIERVAHGDYQPLAPHSYPAEFTPFAARFNQMVASLEAHDRAFQTLNAELSRRAREMNGLYEVSRTVTSSLDAQAVLRLILRETVRSFPTARKGIIHLVDREQNRLIPYALSNGRTTLDSPSSLTLDQSIAGRVIRERRPITVADTRELPDFQATVATVRSLMVMPLAIGERVIGTLTLDSDQPNAFTPNMSATFRSLANQAATALENSRIYSESQAQVRALAALTQSAVALAQPTTPARVAEQARALLGVAAVALRLRDQPGLVTAGDDAPLQGQPALMERLAELLERVVQSGAAAATTIPADGAAIQALALPLRWGGSDEGVLLAVREDERPFDGAEIERASHFALLAGAALGRERAMVTLRAEQERLQASVAELRRAASLESDVVATLIQTLHAPLARLLGSAQALRKGDGSAGVPPALEGLLSSAGELHRLLADLSELAPLERRHAPDRYTLFPIEEAFEVAREATEPLLLPQQQTLRFQAAPLPALWAEPRAIVRLLGHLLRSASAFAPAGGVITVDARQVDDGVMVTVRVSGAEPPARPERGGDPEACEASLLPSAGRLGLAIAARLAARQGGQLEVERAGGQGLRVRLTLPGTIRLPVRWPDRPPRSAAAPHGEGSRS